MSRDHLGLFDTPPSRKQVRLGLAIVGALTLAVLVTLPVRGLRLSEIDSFIPLLDAMMLVADLIIATLLYAQAGIFRSRALSVLAAGFVFGALLLVPHALTFPGAFSRDGLFGAGSNATAWVAAFRRIAFPICIAFYAYLERRDRAEGPGALRPAPPIAASLYGAIALAAAATLVSILGADWLPHIFASRTEPNYVNHVAVNAVSILLCFGAIAMLWPRRSVLDLWLLVAMAGWLLQSLLNFGAGARFTIGWYGLLALMLASNLIVMLALIAESNRLYARLALSTAARSRERDARLMTMDAVTAAIAHEIGQPLTGVMTNAMAGLDWLDRDQPDRAKAIKALSAVIDDGNRTTDVIRSIRAMFAKGRSSPATISLNDLVRETAAFLDRELAGERVVLELTLDEALPPIAADRVQIQRVLVNLFTNALDSLAARRSGPRRIAVRSSPLDGEAVLLEVSDTGIGIEAEEMPRIFEPFFTTKATGAGLGLSLCRVIVEEHGGRLWAAPSAGYGATFHLELPRTQAARGARADPDANA